MSKLVLIIYWGAVFQSVWPLAWLRMSLLNVIYVAANQGYYDKLSEASKGTLKFQGGPMLEEEAQAFEADPHYKDFLRLRSWDEAAKKIDGPIIELEELKAMAQRHLQQQQESKGTS